MPHPVLDAAERFKAAARARELSASNALVRAYGGTYRALQAEIRAISDAVALHDGAMSRAQITRLSSLQVLATETREQIAKFAVTADRLMVEQINNEIAIALADSQSLVEAHFDPEWLTQQGLRFNDIQAGIRASWVRVSVESVESLVGMLEPGSPLRSALVNRLGDAVAEHMIERMVEGIALGKNPRVIARQVLGDGLNWSMTTVRTAQLNAYRYATQANYQANRDVVSGWRWKATLDARTCMGCLAMHGTSHSVDETLNDHHNGRCLLPGQMVTTARGDVPIEQVAVGDHVLTHRGRWQMVQATSIRQHIGKVYVFGFQGTTIRVTPEHPMLTQRGWVEAKDCKATDTFFTLNDIDARVSSRKTVQPSSTSLASRRASRVRRLLVMCQRGSSSTASMASGNAASMLYDSTANCETGNKPIERSSVMNSSSLAVLKVSQSRARVLACAIARRRCGSGASILVIASGERSIWRRAASEGETGVNPDSRIQRMIVRVFMPASAHSSRYDACSATYRRVSQSAIGSPNLRSISESNLALVNLPTSELDNRNPSAFARCNTALCVRPSSSLAMSIGSTLPKDSMMMRSSSGDQSLRLIDDSPLDGDDNYFNGNIIHHPLNIAQIEYVGTVHNLQVEEDESYIANGIVVHNCTQIPTVPLAERLGIPPVDMGNAEEWFSSRTVSQQKAQMGVGMYGAWQDGRFYFRDLTTTYDDPVYGTMRRAPTLTEMLTQ